MPGAWCVVFGAWRGACWPAVGCVGVCVRGVLWVAYTRFWGVVLWRGWRFAAVLVGALIRDRLWYGCCMFIDCVECGSRFEAAGGRGRSPRFCGATCRKRASRRRADVKRVLVERVGDRWVRAVGKRPVMVDGSPASSTNSATWSSFDAVQSGFGDGLGLMCGGGVACLDLDNAVEGGRLKPWAREAVDALKFPVLFTELSMSGRGVHVFVAAPEGRGSSRAVGDGRVEWFPRGRFIRMTFQELRLRG